MMLKGDMTTDFPVSTWHEALPQSAYTDSGLFEIEQKNIWRAEWLFVCRRQFLQCPGDYLAIEVAGKPIMLWVQTDGGVAAFANFCLHRYTQLAQGHGRSETLTCPYHGWKYHHSGRLLAVPFCSAPTRGYDSLSLEPVDCAEWMGCVFVRLASTAAALPVPAPLEDSFRALGVGGLRDVCEESCVVEGNWKLHVENFTESYHLSFVHARSLGKVAPTKLATQEISQQGDTYSLHHNEFIQRPPVHNREAAPDEGHRAAVAAVFPNALLSPSTDMMWWMSVLPLSVDRTALRWGLCISSGLLERHGEIGAHMYSEVKRAMQEDIEAVARVQTGIQCASPRRGKLHPLLESTLLTFAQYWKSKIDA